MANPVGRPTLYRPEMDELVLNYFLECQVKNKMPYLEDVAMMLNIDIDTLESWVNGEVEGISDEFIGAVKKVKLLQRKNLISGGLSESFNPIFSMFMLKVNHGAVETTRNELTGKDGNPLNDGGLIPLFSKLMSKALPDGKQNRGNNKKQSELIGEGIEEHTGSRK